MTDWSDLWREVPSGEKALGAGLALIVTGLALIAAGGAGLLAGAVVNRFQEKGSGRRRR